MEHGSGLTVALALTGGIVAQAIARHLRLPGIVLLLGMGVVLGPDIAGLVHPETLGSTLIELVGFAVAVILFEGGMNLNLRRLLREQRAIRQLISIGALITGVGGTLAAKLIMGWNWQLSILFGSLVIVTGPTVITPLLRRLNVTRAVATVLEAEGVLIDAVGAILATVALEVVLSPSGQNFALGGYHIVAGLGFGGAIGFAGGMFLWLALRFRNVVPEGLENVFTLSWVLALFHISNAVAPESGIVACTMAGIVVGNSQTAVQRELLEFKEQLTVMLIGMLFVLLAADVRIADVQALGWPGVITVAVLMFVVRPLNMFAGTFGTELKTKEKVFMSWIGPRGIVAAAVASFFAAELEKRDMEGATELQAMVFLVIAVTVLSAGLTGGTVARLLGLRRKTDTGWVILGANELARILGVALRNEDEEVVLLDSNASACTAAEKDQLRVLYGNGLEERMMDRAQVDVRRGVIGMTSNAEVNYLFAKKAKEHGKLKRMFGLVDANGTSAHKLLQGIGGEAIFGRPHAVDGWLTRVRRKTVAMERWRLVERMVPESLAAVLEDTENTFIPMVTHRDGRAEPVTESVKWKRGDEVSFLVNQERRDAADAWFEDQGWELLDGAEMTLSQLTRKSLAPGPLPAPA